ncbi:GNAT family N-acetyltransferase [Dokdonella sp.]|uniref:GNAT family N-acetyltransferase n=1 Tax=Dokdonella sp. TaxID=2291710 RepID=UPI002F403921
MSAHATACRHAVALRDLRADDDEFLYRVYAGTRLEELAPLGWSVEQVDTFLRMQYAAQRSDYWRNYDTTRFHVVTCDGVDAGRLYVQRGSDELRIVDIALLPEFRGRGVGGYLLAQLAAEADAAGLAMRIHVERDNPAQHLYLRFGFAFREEADSIYRLMERLPRNHDASRAA